MLEKNLDEVSIISRFFDGRGPAYGALGIGDDAALLPILPQGETFALSTDMLVSGRHFLETACPASLGHKVLAVNLSDLAAMGAMPVAFTLAVALPSADEAWLSRFSEGLFDLAERFQCPLAGGDTNRGPLTFCVTVVGSLPTHLALRRDGAQDDDDIWVSGELGGAAFALACQKRGNVSPDGALQRLNRPEPRVALGVSLRGLARSAIDVSDGFLIDLGRLLQKSQLGADLLWDRMPTCGDLSTLPAAMKEGMVLNGGDDYELVFTAPSAHRSHIEALEGTLGLRLSRVGRVVTKPGIRVLTKNGCAILSSRRGFDHFG